MAALSPDSTARITAIQGIGYASTTRNGSTLSGTRVRSLARPSRYPGTWHGFTIRDTYTGIELTGDWGLRDDLNPGAEYKAIYPFRRSKYSKGCFGRHPVPDSP